MPACRECAGRDLAFSRASAAVCHEGPARALVDRLQVPRTCGRSPPSSRCAPPPRSRSSSSAPEGAGAGLVVTSVPAHRDHRLDRGFDLAESVARRLARDSSLTAPLLRRTRHGARQSGLGKAARAANVHHAFALREPGFG